MGNRYLTDLADVCRRTGFPVIEVDDWPHRARGSGGYDSGRPNHVMCHHTASGSSMDGWGDVNYMTFSHQDAPLCNLYISRDGTIYVCAGGATNTNGSGSDPCGTTANDSMNSSAVGIEVGNNGVGEVYPDRQQDSYVALCRELCDAYIGGNYGRCHAHFEWAPGRKIDNAGNSRYATGGASWNMDQFRADVAAGSSPPPLEDNMRTPAIVVDMDNVIHYFVVGSDHAIWQIWQQGDGWSGWQPLGGQAVGDVSAAIFPDSPNIDIAVEGTDGQIWRRFWNGSEWSGWGPVGVIP